MKIKSIVILLTYMLLLSSLTVPAIACPPPYCGECEVLEEGECEYNCSSGQCCDIGIGCVYSYDCSGECTSCLEGNCTYECNSCQTCEDESCECNEDCCEHADCPDDVHYSCIDCECICDYETFYTQNTVITPVSITAPTDGESFCVGTEEVSATCTTSTDSDIAHHCVDNVWTVESVSDPVTHTWSGPGTFDPTTGTSVTWTPPTTADEYIITVTASDSPLPLYDDSLIPENPDPTHSVTVYVVEVDRIQYKIGGDAYQDAPSTLVVAKGADVTFKAIKNPSSAQWPAGKPVWSGSSGASGTGEEEEVAFDTASSNPTDYKVVQAECGNTVPVNVVVVDLSTLVINANRTSAPSESSYPVKSGEHIELGGTFKFDLMLGAWPTPVKLGAEIWDLDYGNEVIASGSGPTISHTFGTGEKDDGTCKTRFYFDNNTSGDSTTGWNDPKVDSPSYEAQELTYHILTFGKSSAVAGSPGVGDACRDATDLILRKDTADDYRATAKLLSAALSTIPASTHDPLNMERKADGKLYDTWGHWSYFINYDSAEVIIVTDVRPCNADEEYVPPDTAGFSKTGTKYEICLEEGDVNGSTLAHEVGHSCGLGHNNANVDNVMYWTTAGNETLLTKSEAAAYE